MYSNNQGISVNLDFNAELAFIKTLNGFFPLETTLVRSFGHLGYGKSNLLIHPKE